MNSSDTHGLAHKHPEGCGFNACVYTLKLPGVLLILKGGAKGIDRKNYKGKTDCGKIVGLWRTGVFVERGTTKWLIESLGGKIRVAKSVMMIGTRCLINLPLVFPSVQRPTI